MKRSFAWCVLVLGVSCSASAQPTAAPGQVIEPVDETNVEASLMRAMVRLSEKRDGIVQLWQDVKKLVDTRGQTLPLSHSIYNSLEVGLTAYGQAPKPATLYVDDIEISNKPID